MQGKLFRVVSVFIVLSIALVLPIPSGAQTTTIVIDDGCPGADPPGFERERPAAQDPWICISVQRQVYWAYGNNDALYSATNGSPVSWVGWRPTIVTAGRYKVEVSIPSYNQGRPKTQQANYTIQHADGVQTIQIDQSAHAGQWVDLGTYRFNTGTTGYVHISSGTPDNPWRVIDTDAAQFTLVSYDDSTSPDGSITSPTEGSTIGPGTVSITADAWDNPGGSGVNRVEYYAKYDGSWHTLCTDYSAPYVCAWQTPSGLISQRIIFAIHVVDNAGNERVDAGGYRNAIFVSTPQGNEVAIPVSRRFYLNQRSLSPIGDHMCGVSSIAMMLASNGSIGGDYNPMKTEAEKMWNQEGVRYPSLSMVVSAFQRRNYTASSPGGSLGNMWNILKAEINAGRPVAVNSLPGALTPCGHFIVAVGYKEDSDPNQRIIYAYDPFGRHNDCFPAGPCGAKTSPCPIRWTPANDRTPTSAHGRWVAYPWARLNPRIVIARRNTTVSLERLNETALEFEPELIYEGPAGPDGDPFGNGFEIFLPVVIKGFAG